MWVETGLPYRGSWLWLSRPGASFQAGNRKWMIYSSALSGTSVPTEDQSFKGFLQSAFPLLPPTT